MLVSQIPHRDFLQSSWVKLRYAIFPAYFETTACSWGVVYFVSKFDHLKRWNPSTVVLCIVFFFEDNIMSKMLNMASVTSTSDVGDASKNGKSDEDLMTGKKIQKLLVNVFNRFDKDGRSEFTELEYAEFKEAILSLVMNVSETENQRII